MLLLALLALCRLLLGIPVMVVAPPTELRLASVVSAADSEAAPDPAAGWPFLLFPLLLLPLPLPSTPVGPGAAASPAPAADPPTPSLGRALLLLLISFEL